MADHAPDLGAMTSPEPRHGIPTGRSGRPDTLPGGARRRASGRGSWLREHLAILLVVFAYALCLPIVPTLTPAGVGDDWVYVRSVEDLLLRGQLRVLDLSVVPLLFQTAWGSLFAAVLAFPVGVFGATRLSTIAITAIAGAALYGVCRDLGTSRGWSALASAGYLFNPLAFVLAWTFMTDPHFTAVMILSVWAYCRGAVGGPRAGRWLVAGSVFAACAFLVRQQGVLIPPAVLAGMAVAGRVRMDRAGLAAGLRIGAVPAACVVVYYLWLFGVHGVPEQQGAFADTMVRAGWLDTLLLVGRMAFVDAAYLGLFALPVAAAALGLLPRIARWRSRVGWAVVGGWVVLLVLGARHFWQVGQAPPPMPLMPYVPQFFGVSGLGTTTLRGSRDAIVGPLALVALTLLCLVSSAIWAMLVARRAEEQASPDDPARVRAIVALCVLAGQAAGVLPASFHFRDWIVSVDRYLLPLLPLALALGVWALRGTMARLGPAWAVVVLGGVLAVAGTRDFLVFQGATWTMARWALAEGVPIDRLDAGASWDGYYLYEIGEAGGVSPRTPGGPWWTDLFAPATDSAWVVSPTPVPGYREVARMDVDSWLGRGPQPLYLLRREDVPGPP